MALESCCTDHCNEVQGTYHHHHLAVEKCLKCAGMETQVVLLQYTVIPLLLRHVAETVSDAALVCGFKVSPTSLVSAHARNSTVVSSRWRLPLCHNSVPRDSVCIRVNADAAAAAVCWLVVHGTQPSSCQCIQPESNCSHGE